MKMINISIVNEKEWKKKNQISEADWLKGKNHRERKRGIGICR